MRKTGFIFYGLEVEGVSDAIEVDLYTGEGKPPVVQILCLSTRHQESISVDLSVPRARELLREIAALLDEAEVKR